MELEERRSSEFKTRQVSGIGNAALGPRGVNSSLDTIQEPGLRGWCSPRTL